MAPSDSFVSNQFCHCDLPLRVLTFWTPGNLARRFLVCPNRSVECDWYRIHLSEMYIMPNPQERRRMDNEISRRGRIEDLEGDLKGRNGELQKEDGIFISQDKYIAKILKKFNYSDVKSASTPVDLEKPLVKDGDADDVDVHLYRSMIGSLMYLTASRPDIMFAVCACARYQVTPKTSHLLAVKRIFRYLKGKPTLGLWYSRDSSFELVAYTDSDYAGATLE
ncbi:hypothetical protein Tco_1237328 [Tanacetum coccineum]